MVNIDQIHDHYLFYFFYGSNNNNTMFELLGLKVMNLRTINHPFTATEPSFSLALPPHSCLQGRVPYSVIQRE